MAYSSLSFTPCCSLPTTHTNLLGFLKHTKPCHTASPSVGPWRLLSPTWKTAWRWPQAGCLIHALGQMPSLQRGLPGHLV